MLLSGLGSVRIVKNCDLGLENAALGLRPRATFSRPRSKFFLIRTSQPAKIINDNINLVLLVLVSCRYKRYRNRCHSLNAQFLIKVRRGVEKISVVVGVIRCEVR